MEPHQGITPRTGGHGEGSRGRLWRWLQHRRGTRLWGIDPGLYDPSLVERTLRRISPVVRSGGGLFPVDAQGLERIPHAPTMLVSNHSGGTTVVDVWGLAAAWYEWFRMTRPLHAVAHEIILATDTTGSFFSRLGVVRGSKSIAMDVLTHWRRDLLVLPGGDLDAWRPHSDRYRVRFGGRRGYARTAIRAQVPIVPIAHAGAHETLLVLTDGHALAKALHFHDVFRADIFPIHLSLPWIIGIGPWPHLPVPAHLRYRIGHPIEPPAFPRGDSHPPDKLVRALDEEVRRSVQSLLDELRELDGK